MSARKSSAPSGRATRPNATRSTLRAQAQRNSSSTTCRARPSLTWPSCSAIAVRSRAWSLSRSRSRTRPQRTSTNSPARAQAGIRASAAIWRGAHLGHRWAMAPEPRARRGRVRNDGDAPDARVPPRRRGACACGQDVLFAYPEGCEGTCVTPAAQDRKGKGRGPGNGPGFGPPRGGPRRGGGGGNGGGFLRGGGFFGGGRGGGAGSRQRALIAADRKGTIYPPASLLVSRPICDRIGVCTPMPACALTRAGQPRRRCRRRVR